MCVCVCVWGGVGLGNEFAARSLAHLPRPRPTPIPIARPTPKPVEVDVEADVDVRARALCLPRASRRPPRTRMLPTPRLRQSAFAPRRPSMVMGCCARGRCRQGDPTHNQLRTIQFAPREGPRVGISTVQPNRKMRVRHLDLNFELEVNIKSASLSHARALSPQRTSS